MNTDELRKGLAGYLGRRAEVGERAMRVYQYGLRPPNEGADLVRDQLRLAYDYRVLLLRLARARRAAERQVEALAGIEVEQQAVVTAKEVLGVALAKAKRAKMLTQSRTAPRDHRSAITEARKQLRAAKANMSKRRHDLKELLQPERDAIHERWLTIRKAARHESGLRHGTYTAVEDAVDRACKATPLWDEGAAQNPRWPRRDGTGSIGVQLQGGRSLSEVFGEDTFLRVERLPDRFAERCKDGRGGGRRPVYARLWLRVGSEDDRSPVWAKWPMKLHREMPKDSRIKRAMVSLRREGPRERWTVEFTVDESEDYRAEQCGDGTVAIDIGWRATEGTLRVAAWRDDEGKNGTLALDGRMLGGLRKASELRSVRDKHLEAMRPALCEWLRAQGALPEWLLALTVRRKDTMPSAAQAIAHIAQWRSAARFAALAKRWRAQRWNGDGDGHELLETWRYRDHHLWEWESGQRSQSLASRRDLYRCFAAQLVRDYSTIILEDFNLRSVATKSKTERGPVSEGGGRREDRAMSQRQLAATSELRLAIRNAAGARGAKVVVLDPADTTRECPRCGHVETFDAAKQIDRRPPCSKCGHDGDQDDGAAIVLLRRWRERSGDDEPPGTARNPKGGNGSGEIAETRWQRVKRLRAEKETRMGTARKQGANRANTIGT